jgi:malate dehydrogenase
MQSGHTIKMTSNLDEIAGSDVIIFTAGLPRKAGQSRADLIKINTGIVGPIVEKIKNVAPKTFLIMVTNPLDAMVDLAFRKTGFPAEMVVGQAGVLDTGRLVIETSLATKVPACQVNAVVLGGHGPQMVPIFSHTTAANKPLASYISAAEMDAMGQRVADRGATIIQRQGRSAVFSTALAIIKMVKSYLLDLRLALPATARLTGQYGVKDIYVGVMTEISAKGVKVLDLSLTDQEKVLLEKSIEATKAILWASSAPDA